MSLLRGASFSLRRASARPSGAEAPRKLKFVPHACPCCSESACALVASNLRGTDTHLHRCQTCTLEYLAPPPTWDQIQQIYTSDYYKSWGMADGETAEVADMKKATFRLRLHEIARHASPGRVLDVGTASGFFLEVAQHLGWDPFGVELSDYSARLAQRKFGADRIWHGTLETAPFSPGSFDAIAMSDLLEHVLDPVATLQLAQSLLRPGGVLMVTTPDTASLTRRLMGTRWTHYKLEHLTYWNPALLRRAAAQAGLEVLTIHPAWKVMTVRYLCTQFAVYPHPILTPIARSISALAGGLRDAHFRIAMGEMVAILRRPAGSV